MPRSRTTVAASLIALGLLSLAGGCGSYFADGNPLASNDEYNIKSTATDPQTFVLRDLRTDEVLRTWEIPPDTKLFVRFSPTTDGTKNETMPDTCEWLYYPLTTWTPPMEGRQRFAVPIASSRRVELLVRSGPELPPSMKPADVPQPPADLQPIK